jgi:hypothetical protein
MDTVRSATRFSKAPLLPNHDKSSGPYLLFDLAGDAFDSTQERF